MTHRKPASQTRFSTLARLGQRCSPLARIITLCLMALLTIGLISPAAQAQTYTDQILHSFTGGTDQGMPYGSLINVNGVLYGTTTGGGLYNRQDTNYGTIFSINPDGTGYQTLYTFQGGTKDGAAPAGTLLNINGILYGTTANGGTNVTNSEGALGDGTIFAFNPSTHTETILYKFGGGTDGAVPYAGLLNINGILYATTEYGGTSGNFGNGFGTFFSFDPSSNTETVLYRFSGGADGGIPLSTPINVNGILYGATSGTIFSFNPATNTLTTLHTFTGGDGASLYFGSLTNVNGILYGTTFGGGNNDADEGDGVVFSYNLSTSTETTVHEFQGSDGKYPCAGLTLANGILYGTTSEGGTHGDGTFFSVDPSTNTETTLYNLNGNNGESGSFDNLLYANGILYGMGLSGYGSVFALFLAHPSAANDSYAPNYQTAYTVPAAKGVLANDNSHGNGTLTANLVTSTTHGSLTFHADGSFSYTPNTGFAGTDTFTYDDTDAVGTGNTATVTLTIKARTPIAANDSGRTYYNTPMVITAPGVLGNDSNGGSSPITASLVTNPAHGTITFNSDGSFTYVPTAGFLGTDSFTYQDTNSIGTSNVATCTLLVQARTPIAVNDHGTVNHNTTATFAAPAVLGNDNPGTNTGVTAAIVTNPSHGTITFHSDGSFVYTPTIGFIGTDSFTYQDTNSVGTSNTATCTLTVQ